MDDLEGKKELTEQPDREIENSRSKSERTASNEAMAETATRDELRRWVWAYTPLTLQLQELLQRSLSPREKDFSMRISDDATTDPDGGEEARNDTAEEIQQRLVALSETVSALEGTSREAIQEVKQHFLPRFAEALAQGDLPVDEIAPILSAVTERLEEAKNAEEQHDSVMGDAIRVRQEADRIFLEEAQRVLGRTFASREELYDILSEKNTEADVLARNRYGTGRLVHRDKIRLLKAEAAEIQQQLRLWYDMPEFSSHSELYPAEMARRDIVGDIAPPLVMTMLNNYTTLTRQVAEEDEAMGLTEVEPGIVRQLNESFIEEVFLPYLSAHVPPSFSMEQYKGEVVGIIRDSFTVPHPDHLGTIWQSSDHRVAEMRESLHERNMRLPPELQEVLAGFYGREIQEWQPMDESYGLLSRYVSAASTIYDELPFTNGLEAVTGHPNAPFELLQLGYDIPEPGARMDAYVESLVKTVDSRVWMHFRNHPEIRKRFGAEALDAADTYLTDALVRNLTKYYSSPDAVGWGQRLMEYKKPELLPYIILNAYRNPNHFLAGDEVESGELYRYFAGFSEDELTEIRSADIPGVLPLIELFRTHPRAQVFGDRTNDSGTMTFPTTPKSRELAGNLMEISDYLIGKNPASEAFVTAVFQDYAPGAVLEAYHELFKKRGEMPRQFTDALLRNLRVRDGIPVPEKTQEGPEIYEEFHASVEQFLRTVYDPDSWLSRHRELFETEAVWLFLSRQPQKLTEMMQLPDDVPYLFDTLMAEGGPLYTNRNKIVETLLSNGSPHKRAREIEAIFSRKVPYWKQLYLFTEARIGEQLADAGSSYPVSEISGITLSELITRHKQEKAIDPDHATRLEGSISDKNTLMAVLDGKLTAVPYKDLHGMYKKLIFRDRLRTTIEMSRSAEAKAAADERNRSAVAQSLKLEAGTYTHGSPVTVIESVLLNGNLPQEALGEGANTDSYPFQVDFGCLTAEYLERYPGIENALVHSISNGYGGPDGVMYLYRRNAEAYEPGITFGPEDTGDDTHRLLLGGMPSTEIAAVVVRKPEEVLERIKKAVLENGFYIPLYNQQGELLFPVEEYDALREEGNYAVPVETWDFSLKTGEQKGSNPGGEFTVPEHDGVSTYYVKFAETKEADHIWNEFLADQIYRELGLPVPETKVIQVDTAYGHASKIIPVDEGTDRDQLRHGFIADTLLSNWDIMNGDNALMSNGVLYRVDNGGALLFRAQGERKDTFGEEVSEVDSMRSGYPGLTETDISEQVQQLHDRLPDDVIDRIIEQVRLKRSDRETLKTTLKARRDYLLAHFPQSADSVDKS